MKNFIKKIEPFLKTLKSSFVTSRFRRRITLYIMIRHRVDNFIKKPVMPTFISAILNSIFCTSHWIGVYFHMTCRSKNTLAYPFRTEVWFSFCTLVTYMRIPHFGKKWKKIMLGGLGRAQIDQNLSKTHLHILFNCARPALRTLQSKTNPFSL